MSRIAIFRLSCCGREIASGRFQGSDMYPPTREKCPFGCPNKKDPRGKPAPHVMHFDRYEFDDTISPELLKTWKYGHSTGDLWAKYEAKRQAKMKEQVQR